MKKLNYLNVGCGNKFHKDWVNVDMVSSSPHVQAVNLLKGIPFPDNHFEVVYHSQVLEHFPKEKAQAFIQECFRVLKPNGLLRVVLPDLENIIDEYKKFLNQNLENPTPISEANYDWIMLEMFDQTVRNYGGGQMAVYLRQAQLVNEQYIIDRIGFVGSTIRHQAQQTTPSLATQLKKALTDFTVFRKALKTAWHKVKYIFASQEARIGAFRLGGEVHQWMYDRYSLARLLSSCGFVEMRVKNPFESDVPKWSEYELDVKNGMVYDPTSLFMEARKKA
ncbi:MAG: methyltransferase domain-containing protein [Cytophagales bacterium]|nr:MAG: methyltransferase domain-containing protein [Cytophagales bacterium]TAF59865.1 MAG: methyltransferase domain-containing protein [Cytophagales bacterium]